MEAQQPRRYSIGYALALKKRLSFIRESLINLSRDRMIDLIKIDTDLPLIDQGPFDCILHKLYGEDWKQQLVDYKRKNPNVVIIDAPEAIERLHNRISMLQVVSELKNVKRNSNSSDTFGIPKQIVIYDAETLNDPRSWEGLKFPMIAKPLVADGSAKSHKMSLVYNHGGLSNLKPPIVLQEFVNHGGVIFKVYVVGEYVKCVKRKSLPDVSEDKLESLGGLLTFSQVSNLSKNEMTDEKYYKMMHLDDCEMPPLEFITDIAGGLRDALKLNLFNFDVIRDTSLGNRYLVIDINYFPGYAKMPAYESVMTEFFWKVVAKDEPRVGAEWELKDDGSGVQLTQNGGSDETMKESRLYMSLKRCTSSGCKEYTTSISAFNSSAPLDGIFLRRTLLSELLQFGGQYVLHMVTLASLSILFCSYFTHNCRICFQCFGSLGWKFARRTLYTEKIATISWTIFTPHCNVGEQ